MCNLCNKVCKSKGGLKIHQSRKHKQNSAEAHGIDISDTIDECVKKIGSTTYYQRETKLELELFFQDEHNVSEKTMRLTQILSKYKYKDTENAYSDLYKDIVMQSNNLFEELSPSLATLISTKIVDNIISKFKDSHESDNTTEEMEIELTDMEKAGLEYLAGYCIHQLYNKTKTKKDSHEHQISCAVLFACKCDKIENQKLLAAVNRGGLWGVVKEVEEIFLLTEIEFLRTTRQKCVRMLPHQEIIQKIMNGDRCLDLFSLITERAGLPVDDKTKTVILRAILELYLKVRSHSFAKSTVDAAKAKEKSKNVKKKALRKELKKCVEK